MEPVNKIIGVLKTRDYVHFIIILPDGKISAEFEGSKLANKCLPGDIVYWNGDKCILVNRANHPPIVGTIELKSKTKYGVSARGHFKYLFVPYSEEYPYMIVGCSEKDVSCNRIGVVTIAEWHDNRQFPNADLIRTLGISGEPAAEKDAVLWQYCPYRYTSKFLKNTASSDIDPPLSVRQHIGDGLTINIDPIGCRDIDDVITFIHIRDTLWKIIITISDVACQIEDGCIIDKMARHIGQTFYLNGIAKCPMLPPTISEESCSLLPGQPRTGVSLEFLWNGQEGIEEKITDKKWYCSSFTNNRSYSYEEFQISHELPERCILQQISTFLERSEELIEDSHKWVEACMKLYNTEAGCLLRAYSHGILRMHAEPDREKLQKYVAIEPSLAVFAYSSAVYCPVDNTGTTDTRHFGIGVSTYCHATSPIRRYSDLINQRIIKKIIDGCEDITTTTTMTIPDIVQTVERLNSRSKAIKSYDRDILFIQSALDKGLAERRLNGIIIDIIEKTSKDGRKMYKIKIFIKAWNKCISCLYNRGDDLGEIISNDETMRLLIVEAQHVQIYYAINMNGRRWKQRIVFTLFDEEMNNTDDGLMQNLV